jgi:hypothetical protein
LEARRCGFESRLVHDAQGEVVNSIGTCVLCRTAKGGDEMAEAGDVIRFLDERFARMDSRVDARLALLESIDAPVASLDAPLASLDAPVAELTGRLARTERTD